MREIKLKPKRQISADVPTLLGESGNLSPKAEISIAQMNSTGVCYDNK